MICYIKNDKPTYKKTKYMCKTCEMYICPDKCYDYHRRSKNK